jgi:negative regulator of flagellin synthesis FlgM
MTIGNVNAIDPIQPAKSNGRIGQVEKPKNSDSINISAEASKKADWLKTIETATAAPDVRADLVAEMKIKINDPSYINEALLNGTVDKILDDPFMSGYLDSKPFNVRF